jgi:hypothetical protein
MSSYKDDDMAQFLPFAEAKILPVITSIISLEDLLNAYRVWWSFEGKRSGRRLLNDAVFQACFNKRYGFTYYDSTYRGLYVSYA